MGMDGLSMANTGMLKESTSADFANKTEQTIQSEAMQEAQQVQSLSVNPRVKRKEEEEQESKKNKNQAQEETFEDGLVEEPQSEDDEEVESSEDDNLNNLNKDFYVKLNAKDDIIELYDSSTNRMVETISGNELGELVQKLNMASGIFINKKV